MPSVAELLEQVAREAERRKILEIALSCANLEEFIAKLRAMNS